MTDSRPEAGVTGVSIVGLGAVGQRFLHLMHGHPRYRVVSAADPDPAARAVAVATGVAAFDRAGPAVAASGVDLVYVAVPPLGHAEVVDLALRDGRALLCEKPLGVDPESSRALVRRVEAAAVPAAVNFVHAAAPATTALRALLNPPDGTAALAVRGAELRVELPEWPRPFQAHATWLASRAEGGPTREVVSHFLFLATRLLGPLRLRRAAVGYPDGPDGTLAEDRVAATLSSESGVDLTVHVRVGASSPRTELGLDAGESRVVLSDFYRLHLHAPGGPRPLLAAVESSPEAAYLAQLDDVAALLNGQAHTTATFAEALAVQELVEAILRSGG